MQESTQCHLSPGDTCAWSIGVTRTRVTLSALIEMYGWGKGRLVRGKGRLVVRFVRRLSTNPCCAVRAVSRAVREIPRGLTSSPCRPVGSHEHSVKSHARPRVSGPASQRERLSSQRENLASQRRALTTLPGLEFLEAQGDTCMGDCPPNRARPYFAWECGTLCRALLMTRRGHGFYHERQYTHEGCRPRLTK